MQMEHSELLRVLRDAECRCIGIDGYLAPGHRRAVAAVVQAFKNQPETTILCEPSMARSTNRPPDIVVVDWRSGIHVVVD